jgi:hypothetical protein
MTGRPPDRTASAGLPKVRPAAKNLSTGSLKRDARRLTQADVERGARLAQHGACVDHVQVAGIHQPVCVLRGQDPAAVAAEARALVGLVVDR